MKKNTKKYNSKILILLVTLFFGVLGGAISSFYLWTQFFDNFWDWERELYLESPEYRSGVVIKDPRKVYVSQDIKIEETHNYLNKAVLGLFSKNEEDENYIITNELFSGVLISDNGWVMLNVLGLENLSTKLIKDKDSYVLVSRGNKEVYEIEDLFDLSDEGLIFLKINDNGFSLRNFVDISDLKPGKSVLAHNYSGQSFLSSISFIDSGGSSNFSDNFSNNILLSDSLSNDFSNNFLFDLNGNLAALIDSNLKIKPVHDFRPFIYAFLGGAEELSFDLGLYYMDLKYVVSEDLPRYGAWVHNDKLPAIVKGGLADSAGLKEGDVITKINNYEIDNQSNLNDVLNNFVWGDKVSVFVLRDGEIKELEMTLK
jgi:serine protease Do